MSHKNKIEAEKLSQTTDFLPSGAASCSALARSEFCELLKMPQPKTDRDYRRAILMAYVMGQVSQFDVPNDLAQTRRAGD